MTSLDVDLRKSEKVMDLRIERRFEKLKKERRLEAGRRSESYI